jgi:hypothetical protein
MGKYGFREIARAQGNFCCFLSIQPIRIHHIIKDSDSEDNNKDSNDYPRYGACVICAHILVFMAALVSNGNVRIQVQFVWTHLMTTSERIRQLVWW